jgi:Tripartite tricarboxylate transporter TctB family
VTLPDKLVNTAEEDRPAAGETCEPDRPPAAGRITNLVTAAAVVALGGAALAGSISMGVGEAASPRPGTWPMLISLMLIVLGLALAFRSRNSDAERFTHSALTVVAAVASMIVYVAVIGTIGVEIPTAVLAFVWMKFIGRERWLISAIVSVAVTVALYALFVGALSVNIPHLF